MIQQTLGFLAVLTISTGGCTLTHSSKELNQNDAQAKSVELCLKACGDYVLEIKFDPDGRLEVCSCIDFGEP
jgi:hypothetical protein